MNRVTSSSNPQTKKCPQSLSQPKPPVKKKRVPTNPLTGFSTRSSGNSNCSNGSGSGSQRLLLAHSFSSSSSSSSTSSSLREANSHGGNRPIVKLAAKTPNSAPVMSKPLIRKKPMYHRSIVTEKTNLTSRKRLTSKITMKSEKGLILKKQVKLKDSQTTIRVNDSVVTPVSKGSDFIGRSSNSSSSNQEKTPPVQASVSPEIQFGSSMDLSASACYAAGHLLSGVRDKRKCKPKGILTVGENGEFGNISMMPSPVNASVQWKLSPCDEEEKEGRYEDGSSSQFQQSVVEIDGHETLLPLSDRSTSSDLCNLSSGRSVSPIVRRISSSLSPNELSRFRRFMHLSSCEGVEGDNASPLSVDTLGSENVIQTPESNSSFDSYLRLLSSQADIQKTNDVGSVLESLRTSLQSTRLLPRSHASAQEPSSSSFNFDSLVTSSDSIDLSQFHRGLVNKRPELKSQQITDTEFDIRGNKEGAVPTRNGKEVIPCSVAESIITDGCGLICSEDSNWMDCYKN